MKTQKTDNRSIAQVAKAVATMRKKVASAVKRHEKLQSRIAKLAEASRIISFDRDCDIIAGDGEWYVKAESLNTNPDSISNWYYILTCDEHGYTCRCESVKPCKHITKLSASFAPVQESTIVTLQMGNVTLSEPIANLHNAVAHEIWRRKVLAEVREDPARKAEREARLQREADAMVACASRKYDAPLNGRQGFSLLRV
jgi:hypothetical protein